MEGRDVSDQIFKKISIIFLFWFLNFTVWAAGLPNGQDLSSYSPLRPKGISFQSSRDSFLKKLSRDGKKLNFTSALNVANAYENTDLSRVPVWQDKQTLDNLFYRLRDERFINPQSSFPRRSTWLYPDDGCYARAGLMAERLTGWHEFTGNALAKIFAFGNLKVLTANNSRGAVYWWYHVAVIAAVNAEYYILDPAVEPRAPLPLKKWLQLINQNNQEL
jgi:hypothetical protein